MRKTKMSKFMVSVPLSLTLLIPLTGLASAEDHSMHAMSSMSTTSTAKTGTPEVSNKAVDLRAALDSLLSEHAFLAVMTMQKGIDGKDDFDAIAKQLNQNTDDLSKAVGSVYGDEAGQQFKEIWGSHIGYFVDYVKASAANAENGKKQAMTELDQYRVKQADFLSKATDGRMKASELEAGLKVHVNELLWAFDNYKAGNFDKAYESVRESIHHMYGVGKGLSWAITTQFPDKFDKKGVDTPAADLREDLNHLFSEHAALAILTMQKGADGSPDFNAASAALSKNTDDLSAAVGSVYGMEGGEAFKKIWGSHIGYFVEYVKAAGAGDEAGKAKAISELDAYRVEQAKFLDTATGGRLKAADLEAGLKMHVDELLKAFDSYTKLDYATTYPTLHESYDHMFGVGLAVSGAIVDQFPAKFQTSMPAEMPKTGMGGMSESTSGGLTDIVLLGSLAALTAALAAALIIVRRKSTNK